MVEFCKNCGSIKINNNNMSYCKNCDKKKKEKNKAQNEHLIHIQILKCFDELKFNVGKKTLIDLLKGGENPAINRNNLDELKCYGSLYKYEEDEIEEIINQLIDNNLLYQDQIKGGFRVIGRSILGTKEIYEKKFKPKLKKNKNQKFDLFSKETIITDKDRRLFQTFDFFLNKFNDEQKKAIISSKNNILTIAGAGSGKTTILTKRIEFLTKFRGVLEGKILAITFTKKAKEEMINRLKLLNIENVRVETFNSFCEKILKKYENKIYSKNTRVITFSDKIKIVKGAISKLNINFELLIDEYFTKKQIREKTKDELFFIFINDLFTILDYYKNLDKEIDKFYENETGGYYKKQIAKQIYNIVLYIENELKKQGLRDFSDQVIDALRFLRENPEYIPKFEHILIDEFQDLNKIQFELTKLLYQKSIFAVGDPRQAIYGWRGSNIEYILSFPKEFENTQIISLKYNYRSGKKIVRLFNEVIKPLNFIDLESKQNFEGEIYLKEFINDNTQEIFVLESIKNSKNKRCEIFVLARTNRILENYAKIFSEHGIAYIIKSEEDYKTKQEPKENEVVLATVHSIKGMEAKEVYVVGCNNLSFPNKAKDNFILELIKKDNDYDKYNEEIRLFYVALSRAKEKLIITYSGNLTKFLTNEAIKIIGENKESKKDKSLFSYSNELNPINNNSQNKTIIKNLLKNWRAKKANELGGIPTYMIISNKAIEELSLLKPSSKAELFNISGLGEVKIAKYGEEILKIING